MQRQLVGLRNFAFDTIRDTLGLVFVLGFVVAFVSMPVFLVLKALEPLWPITTTLFVIGFTVKALRAGRLNAVFALCGIADYITAWPATYYWGTPIGLMIWFVGVLSWIVAVYWAFAPADKAKVVAHFKSNWNYWLIGIGFVQFVPWVVYGLLTEPAYDQVRVMSDAETYGVLASLAIVIASITIGILVDEKVHPYRGEQ